MHPPRSEEELTALRARLYRPDPPEGAVDAYLDAVHPDEPIATVDPPPAPSRPRRRGRGVVALVVLVAAVLVALALGATITLSHRAPAPVIASAAAAARLPLPQVPGTPIGTLYGPRSTTGRFDANGSQVVVSVNCTGSGTLDVRIADEPATVLTCVAGDPALALVPSTGALHGFTVAIRQHAAVRWSLAVGAVDLTAG